MIDPEKGRWLAEIIARYKPTLGSWYCDTGNCIPQTEQIYLALNHAQPGWWRMVWAQRLEPTVQIQGKPVRIINGHQFLVKADTAGTPEEVIVDPTIRQFFSAIGGRRIPGIFVGTRIELIELFRRNSQSLRVQPIGENAPTRGADPDELVDIFYGLSHGREEPR